MTPSQLLSIRRKLKLSQKQFGLALGLTGKEPDRQVRRWESGEREISARATAIAKDLARRAISNVVSEHREMA